MLFSITGLSLIHILGIIQSYGQLERNYGKEGCSIILDNAQDTIAGGFSPRGRYSGTGVAPAGRADGDDGECEQGEKRPVPLLRVASNHSTVA